jgi:hypothetical protein
MIVSRRFAVRPLAGLAAPAQGPALKPAARNRQTAAAPDL